MFKSNRDNFQRVYKNLHQFRITQISIIPYYLTCVSPKNAKYWGTFRHECKRH